MTSVDLSAFQMKASDRLPSLVVGLEFNDNTQVSSTDLANATSIVLKLKNIDTGTIIIGNMSHLTGDSYFPNDNAVKYDWQEDDTNEAGIYIGEIVVTFADSKTMTFPNNSRFVVQINAQLS